MLDKELVKSYMIKHKSFGRDITEQDYKELKILGLVGFFFSLCVNSVNPDKFEVYAENKEGVNTSIWTGWSYNEAIKILRSAEEQAAQSRRQEKFKLVRFPYTISKLSEYEAQDRNQELKSKMAIELNSPPVESYEEDIINQVNF